MTRSTKATILFTMMLCVLLGCRDSQANETSTPAVAADSPKILRHIWGPVYDKLRPSTAQPPIRISGIVFADKNGDGTQNEQEKGVAGVAVSDGVQVVLTGKDGRYTLSDVIPGLRRFVFISIPTGYSLAAKYYQKIPATTGNLNATFPLSPDPKSNDADFRFIHLTDTHNNLPGLLEALGTENVRFGVLTGDLANDASNTKEFIKAAAALEKTPVPLMLVPGNHDLLEMGCRTLVTHAFLAEQRKAKPETASADTKGSPELYEEFFGPTYYSFNYGGRHFVVLNSLAEEERQREWLKKDLAALNAKADLYVFQHYPPERELTDFLAQFPVRAVFFGHSHADLVTKRNNMLLVSSVGIAHSRDFSPQTFRVVNLKGQTIKLENHASRYGNQAKLPALPKPQAKTPAIRANTDYQEFKSTANRCGATTLQLPAQMKLAWTKKLNGSTYFGSPLIMDKTLYIGIGDRTNTAAPGVYALDPATGDVRWHYKTTSRPALSSGGKRIYAAEYEAVVHALNGATGKKEWSFTLGDPGIFRQLTPALFWKNRVMVGNGKHFVALHADSGKPAWHMPDVGAGFWPNYAAPVLAEDKILVAVPGSINLRDANTGKELWTIKDIPINAKNPSTPLIFKSTIYLLTQGTLYALEPSSGKKLWQTRIKAYASSPVADQSGVYLAGDHAIIKFSLKTGEEIWRCTELTGDKKKKTSRFYFPNKIMATPLLTKTYLFVATTDGELASIDIETGKMASILELNRPFVASPAASGNALFLSAYDGTVFGLVASE